MDSNPTAGEETGVSDKKASSSAQELNDASGAGADDREEQIRAARFVLPVIDGGPSKVLTLDELSRVLGNIENMELLHKIAIDPKSKLTPHQPSGNRMDSNSSASEETGVSEKKASSSTQEMNDASGAVADDREDQIRAARFVLPGIDGGPSKVLTLDELSHVYKNMQNMELVHEIAINPKFKLTPHQPSGNSLEGRIKECMHNAFWAKLRQQLESDPPCYDHAIQLLDDIKESFSHIFFENNKRTLAHINEVLDKDVIRQQAENGVLDFSLYAKFVLEIMAKSCAPTRDETIQQLMQITDVVDTFRGILETMSLMKLDIANYILHSARNDIIANSVKYERAKFQDFLKYYKCFPATENWLRQNCKKDVNMPPISIDQTIINAYLDLMDWPTNLEFPEVFYMDNQRILELAERARRLCACAALFSICNAVPIVAQYSDHRSDLSKQFLILLQNAKSQEELNEAIINIWEHVKIKINEYLQKYDQPTMNALTEDFLKTQIVQLTTKDSPVRTLMWKRLQTYVRFSILSKNEKPPPLSSYDEFKEELETYTALFGRIITYNHSIYGDYLKEVLSKIKEENAQSSVNETSNDAAGVSSVVNTASDTVATKDNK